MIPSQQSTPTHPGNSTPPSWFHHAAPIFTCANTVLFVFFCANIVLKVVNSGNPFLAILFMILALAPAYVFAYFIVKSFPDPAVPNHFLFLQFLLSAIPLILLIIPLEIVLGIISLLPLFLVYHDKIIAELQGIEEDLTTNDTLVDNDDELLKLFADSFQRLLKYIPFWAIAITLIAVAVLSAGTAEELGKWLVSRRFRLIDDKALASGSPRVSARGIFATACMSGLGFATIENIGYVMSIGSMPAATWMGVFVLALMALFRGALALAVHVGTQLYVAVTAAQIHLFSDGGSVVGALLNAILFHGFFDAIAFVTIMATVAGKIPMWFTLLVPVVDVILVLGLVLLVRSRYRALLERENALSYAGPEV